MSVLVFLLPKLLQITGRLLKEFCSPVDVFNYSCKKHMLLAALQFVEKSQFKGRKVFLFLGFKD